MTWRLLRRPRLLAMTASRTFSATCWALVTAVCADPFDIRTYLSETVQVRGNEFIRQVHRYAKDHDLRFE